MKTRYLAAYTSVCLAIGLATPAGAEDFPFTIGGSSFGGGPSVQITGIMTGHWLTGNEWLITGVQGTMNGLPVMLSGTGYGIPDDILYTGAGWTYVGPPELGSVGGFPLDQYGLGFSNGQTSVLFSCGSISYFQPDCEMAGAYGYGPAAITFTQVPEPPILALLMLGFSAAGLGWRQRRRR
jgi:PEP-CTERM motif